MRITTKPIRKRSFFLWLALLLGALALSSTPLAADPPDDTALAIQYAPQNNGQMNLVPGGIEIVNGDPRDRLKVVNISGTPQPPLFIDSTDPDAGFRQLFVKGVDVTTATIDGDIAHAVLVNSNVSTITLENGMFRSLQLLGTPETPGASPAVDIIANGESKGQGRGRPVMLHTRQPFNQLYMPGAGRVFIFATNYGEGDNEDIGSLAEPAEVTAGYIHNFLIFRDAWLDVDIEGAKHVRGFRSLSIDGSIPGGAQTLYGRTSLSANITSDTDGSEINPPINVPGRSKRFSLWNVFSSGPVGMTADVDYDIRRIRAGNGADLIIDTEGGVQQILVDGDAYITILANGDLKNTVATGVLNLEGYVDNAGQIRGDQGLDLDFAAGWEYNGLLMPEPNYSGSVDLIQSDVYTSGTLHVSPEGVPTVIAPTDNLSIVTSE